MARITLVKSIVNKNKELIGFVLKGKERDLGGISDSEIERTYPIKSLIDGGFKNSQVATAHGRISELGSFKINSLPMAVYTGAENAAEQFTDIDNSVAITQRFVKKNENIGFRVRFSDGSEDNLRYEKLMALSKWFKPDNFMVRRSTSGKSYICGKDIILDTLPQILVGEQPKKEAKKTKSAAKDVNTEVSGKFENGFDVIDLYKTIKSCHGVVINLAGETYKSLTIDGDSGDGEFTSLGIGEVASPVIAYNPIKINANTNFKKVGIVPVEINGNHTNITTFVQRTKSIFVNGEQYIKNLAVAVPLNTENDLVDQLGKSLALTKIEDKSIIQPLSQVIDSKSLAFYKVETSKLDLISEVRRKTAILSNKEIKELCEKQYELKLISKYLGPIGGVIKEMKAVLTKEEIASGDNRKLFGLFGMMNEESLKKISEAGINIYTGMYNGSRDTVKKTSKAESAIDDEIEIEYSIRGKDFGKISGKVIKQAGIDGDTSKISGRLIKLVKQIESIESDLERYKKATEIYDKTDKSLQDINYKLWLHNSAMFIEGGKGRIHSHDTDKWQPDATSKVKTAQVYECLENGASGLIIKFKGVAIQHI